MFLEINFFQCYAGFWFKSSERSHALLSIDVLQELERLVTALGSTKINFRFRKATI